MQLTGYQKQKQSQVQIKVKVINKSDKKKCYNSNFFFIDVTDSFEKEIRIYFWHKQFDMFYEKIKKNEYYTFKHLMVKIARNKYYTPKHQYELKATIYTQCIPIPNITKFKFINNKIYVEDKKKQKETKYTQMCILNWFK